MRFWARTSWTWLLGVVALSQATHAAPSSRESQSLCLRLLEPHPLVEIQGAPGLWMLPGAVFPPEITDISYRELFALARKREPLPAFPPPAKDDHARHREILAAAIKERPEKAATIRHPPVGLPLPHEVHSSARFAEIFAQDYGESLVLIPSLDSHALPGFDGVVLDHEGNPTVSFSLKNVHGSHPEKAIEYAMEKGLRYQDPDSWISMARASEKRGFPLSQEWLDAAMALFGVTDSSPRPFRVLIELERKTIPFPSDPEIEAFQRTLEDLQGRVESIVILRGGISMTITARDVKTRHGSLGSPGSGRKVGGGHFR